MFIKLGLDRLETWIDFFTFNTNRL